MMRIFITCLVLVLLGCQSETSLETQYPKPDDALFVEEFLRQQFSYVSNNIPLIIEQKLSIKEILNDDENIADFTAALISETEGLDKKLTEAAKSFCARNAEPGMLDSIGKIAINHIVLTEKQMNDLFGVNRERWMGGVL